MSGTTWRIFGLLVWGLGTLTAVTTSATEPISAPYRTISHAASVAPKLSAPSSVRTSQRGLPKTFQEQTVWLRKEFEKARDNVLRPDSKPTWETWRRALTKEFNPIRDRGNKEVYWEHIALRYLDDVDTDVQRNYSPDLVLVSNHGNFNGRQGLLKSAEILDSLLPDTQYTMVDTVVQGDWVTERWAYYNHDANLMILDGLDSFLIKNGQIQVKLINYNVVPADISQEEFLVRLGIGQSQDRTSVEPQPESPFTPADENKVGNEARE